MKTATRKQFLEAIAKHGAELDESKEEGGVRLIAVYAPDNHLWEANDATVIRADNDGSFYISECYADAIERMNYGTRKMTEEELATF